jgi:predicted metal-dependent hydrolase
MDYKVIRSNRRSIAIHITREGSVEVRAPLRISDGEINSFVAQKQSWIEKHTARIREQKKSADSYSLTDGMYLLGKCYPVRFGDRMEFNEQFIIPQDTKKIISWYKKQARAHITKRVEHYLPIMGVEVEQIRIGSADTLWGSCSAKGNLNFTWKLIQLPDRIIDYIVVHELAHRIHMNHSAEFWQTVKRVIPDYTCIRASLRTFEKQPFVQYWQRMK